MDDKSYNLFLSVLTYIPRISDTSKLIEGFIGQNFFAFIGTFILDFFGITISAFRIAGGILIARVGFQMIYEEDDNTNTSKKTKKKEKTTMLNKEALALVPLAVPMLSGAGAMNTTISLMNDAKNIFEHFYVILSIIFVFVITFYILINARYIEKILGEKGKSIFLKIMGLLTFIIGIQFIINGFTIMLSGWGLI